MCRYQNSSVLKKVYSGSNSFVFFQNIYSPRRKYKRQDAGPDDEKIRVRITLLEYGDKGIGMALPNSVTKMQGANKSAEDAEIYREHHLDAVANEVMHANSILPLFLSMFFNCVVDKDEFVFYVFK